MHAANYNEWMLAIRYVALAALAVWLGGMLILGLVVAPSTFHALAAADPAGGRVLAGVAFGEVLRQFHLVAYACGAIVLGGLFTMKFLGPPPRAAIVALMLGVAVYSGVLVSGELATVQARIEGPVSRLPETDARRLRFDQLHRLSTALMTINMALGLVLLSWYVRE